MYQDGPDGTLHDRIARSFYGPTKKPGHREVTQQQLEEAILELARAHDALNLQATKIEMGRTAFGGPEPGQRRGRGLPYRPGQEP